MDSDNFKRYDMKKLIKILLDRRLIIILLLILQAVLIAGLILGRMSYIIPLLELLSVLVVLYVINRRDKGAYKIAWIMLMLTVPVFGGLCYLVVTGPVRTGAFRRYVKQSEENTRRYLATDPAVTESFGSVMPSYLPQARYLTSEAGAAMYDNSKTEYFSPGEAVLPLYLKELEAATEFIFIEYFIIDSDDSIWLAILDILRRKAAEGVDVRVMYDDMGCASTLPETYHRTLAAMGIKATVFNRFRPFISSLQNNRDHRKITVIDGNIAFTGGMNLADEYINRKERYGHWLDCAVSVRGEAVRSFTVMFLGLWNAVNRTEEDFSPYLKSVAKDTYKDGYIIPYSDSPVDDENVSEHIYMQIINGAKDYIYLETPYFIIDDSMLSAFVLAAKSGVDVRIITPGIPDKHLVHMTTRSYYEVLVRAGVRVYEYTPGFVHSKLMISDDTRAVIGTANLDFRSLYLHYECGEVIYNSSAIDSVKRDFLTTLTKCREITEDDIKRNIFVRLGHSLLRIFAPLL